jgi:hypothetical protein
LCAFPWLREDYFFKGVPADYDEAVENCAAQEERLAFSSM